MIAFVGCRNTQGKDTTDQMASVAHGMESKNASTQIWQHEVAVVKLKVQ